MTDGYDALTVRFKAMAHPVRLQILNMLRRGEVCVCHVDGCPCPHCAVVLETA